MTRMSKPPAKPLPARAGISELGPGCVRAGEGSDPVGPSRMWIGKGGDGMGRDTFQEYYPHERLICLPKW